MTTPAEWKALFEAHKKLVYAVLHLALVSPQERDELSQEVWTRVFEHHGSFQGRARISTWIFSLARNTVRSYLQGKSRQRRMPSGPTNLGRSLEDHVVQKLELQHAMSRLTDAEQEIVFLKYSLGHSYDQLADILGVPVTTVRSRLFEARRKLREVLQTDRNP